MREILFRAKRKDNGEWIEGWFLGAERTANIIDDNHDIFPVDPTTVCQFTGLTDKNGKKIFEGDIVKIKTIKEDMITTIVYRKGFFIADSGRRSIVNFGIGAFEKQQIKIIGNIIDNHELLQQEKR